MLKFKLVERHPRADGFRVGEMPAAVAAAAGLRVVALVGVARGGKSTLGNLIAARLAPAAAGGRAPPFTPDDRDAGGAHGTVGIDAAFYPAARGKHTALLVLDCQGVGWGNGADDAPLLLAAYRLASLFVFNQGALLANDALDRLTPMAAFAPRGSPAGDSRPSMLFRVRDYALAGDGAADDFRFDGADAVATLLAETDARGHPRTDAFVSIRAAFRERLFASVAAVATPPLGRGELRALRNDAPAAFLAAQPEFTAAVDAIGAALGSARAWTGGEFAEAVRALALELGGGKITAARDFDMLHAVSYTRLAKWIAGYRTPEYTGPFAASGSLADETAIGTRRMRAADILADFDAAFAEVNPADRLAARADLESMLRAPLDLALAANIAAAEATRAQRNLTRNIPRIDMLPGWYLEYIDLAQFGTSPTAPKTIRVGGANYDAGADSQTPSALFDQWYDQDLDSAVSSRSKQSVEHIWTIVCGWVRDTITTVENAFQSYRNKIAALLDENIKSASANLNNTDNIWTPANAYVNNVYSKMQPKILDIIKSIAIDHVGCQVLNSIVTFTDHADHSIRIRYPFGQQEGSAMFVVRPDDRWIDACKRARGDYLDRCIGIAKRSGYDDTSLYNLDRLFITDRVPILIRFHIRIGYRIMDSNDQTIYNYIMSRSIWENICEECDGKFDSLAVPYIEAQMNNKTPPPELLDIADEIHAMIRIQIAKCFIDADAIRIGAP